MSFEGGGAGSLLVWGSWEGTRGPAFAEVFMQLWKKIAIVVVAWAASVLVYVEFFQSSLKTFNAMPGRRWGSATRQ